jgi:AraC-like DNA-binding protein
MQYGFDPVNYHRVIETNPMFYKFPEFHPTRIAPDFHDIFYLIDGCWSVWLEDEEINLSPGDMAILPARFRYYGRKLCKKQTRTYYIHFSVEQTDKMITDVSDSTGDLLLVRSHLHDNGSILKYFMDILSYFWSDAPHREKRCSSALYLLLSEINDIIKVNSQKHDRLILDLLDIIAGHTDKFFTISELAKKACISPKSLTTRFRKETGQSLHKYQLNKKLDRAALLLETESISLKNLAYSFGFYDEFHFSSAFKKKFNISPGRYSKEKAANS